jgi:uncharacterized protein YjbI with pentapeptide repeats
MPGWPWHGDAPYPPTIIITILKGYRTMAVKLFNRHTGSLFLEIEGNTLIGADLSGADLSGADLSGAKLIGANLARANLARTKF